MLNVLFLSLTLLSLALTILTLLVVVKFVYDFREKARQNRRIKNSLSRLENEKDKKLKQELKRKVEEIRNGKKSEEKA